MVQMQDHHVADILAFDHRSPASRIDSTVSSRRIRWFNTSDLRSPASLLGTTSHTVVPEIDPRKRQFAS
jgi:hypothetical protein